ncbi:MAG: sigma-70 family RNA polymerase sigma factor [Candidatus Omnitrophica bacterium]|nr:sigma-70 family RNA polymerase sigma factor [Candidatus Omnitrophota bacterium]
MLTLELEPVQDERLVFVQEEPALEIALPQTFDQPLLTTMQRGKLANAEALVAKLYRGMPVNPQGGLGPEYQELVTEFAPLFTWATACWDYLLSTEGCRFVPRNGEQKGGARGDYRVVTDKDYSRMVHSIFRACVVTFAQTPEAASLSQWLRPRFWPLVLEAYRRLEQPSDPRQRTLTPYSYLRCIPYQFLNDYHHHLVYTTVHQLTDRERQAIDTYFFHFYTETATADALGCSAEEALALLRQGLIKLLIHHRLVYCLLRQIERY